jgi:tetratricopeptide (TPR) repeat protein
MRSGIATIALLLIALALALPGCHWSAMQSSSRSLAASRQLSQQGASALEHGQWDRAETLLSQAVKACPSNSEARRSYAETLWHRGQQREAIEQLKEALDKDPSNAALHVRLAEMRLEQGDHAAALNGAQQAIRLEPKLASAWVVQARVQRAKRELLESLASYHRALGYSPTDRQIPLEMSTLYVELNQPQRALATLQALADSYVPGEEPQKVLYEQGVAYLALERYDDAVQVLSAAAVRGEATPEVLCQLAQAQWAAGRSGDAAASARQALALDPQHQPSRRLLEKAQLAQQSAGTLR